MADTKISDLTALTGADAATTDVFPVVDVDANTTKKMTRAEMFLNTPPIAVTGTLSSSSAVRSGGDFTVSGAGNGLFNNTITDGLLFIYADGTAVTGALFYGSTHATKANKIEMKAGSTVAGTFSSTALTLGTGANLVMASATTVRLGGYTVATLPAAGTAGRTAYVTDATAPTYLGVLTGGGAVVCPVFDNGVAWVSA